MPMFGTVSKAFYPCCWKKWRTDWGAKMGAKMGALNLRAVANHRPPTLDSNHVQLFQKFHGYVKGLKSHRSISGCMYIVRNIYLVVSLLIHDNLRIDPA